MRRAGCLFCCQGPGVVIPQTHGRALWCLFGRVLACSPRQLGEDSRGSGAFARAGKDGAGAGGGETDLGAERGVLASSHGALVSLLMALPVRGKDLAWRGSCSWRDMLGCVDDWIAGVIGCFGERRGNTPGIPSQQADDLGQYARQHTRHN